MIGARPPRFSDLKPFRLFFMIDLFRVSVDGEESPRADPGALFYWGGGGAPGLHPALPATPLVLAALAATLGHVAEIQETHGFTSFRSRFTAKTRSLAVGHEAVSGSDRAGSG
jgi:hypothetical protein